MDKVWHFLASMLIVIVVAFLVANLWLGKAASVVIGFALAMVAGVAKETYDVYKGDSVDYERFNTKDILADVIGALFGVLIAIMAIVAPWDWVEFGRFAGGMVAIGVPVGLIGALFVRAIFDPKEWLYPKYGKDWWKSWKHKKDV